MVVIMEQNATEEQIQHVIEKLNNFGFDVHRSTGIQKTVLGAIGEKRGIDINDIKVLPGVMDVIQITEPYKLAGRTFKSEDTIINVGKAKIGSDEVVVMAGPCSVESREQIFEIAKRVKSAGAVILRGGAYKPRTSPYSFQGLGEDGLKILKEAGNNFDLPIITEVMDRSQIEEVCKYADILQVGARNMQNFNLLKDLGKIKKPVLLKRGISATIEEWLLAAEYILSNGNREVILCERGIRTFEKYTRNTLDISAIPVVKKLSHLPVIVDPSHATGIRNKVIPVGRAAVAAGADGLLIEVHPDPEKALSDGAQSLYPDQFDELMKQIKLISQAIGRRTNW
jgi:3-deoxy-7-phosphoheptulonate synthase